MVKAAIQPGDAAVKSEKLLATQLQWPQKLADEVNSVKLSSRPTASQKLPTATRSFSSELTQRYGSQWEQTPLKASVTKADLEFLESLKNPKRILKESRSGY